MVMSKDEYRAYIEKQMATAKTPAGKKEEEKEKLQQQGAVEMHYGEYKNNYSNCKTVPNSYNAKTKTIMVYVNKGKCPKCGTYCYGDCQA